MRKVKGRSNSWLASPCGPKRLAMLLDGLEWTRVSLKPVKQPAVVSSEVRIAQEPAARGFIV